MDVHVVVMYHSIALPVGSNSDFSIPSGDTIAISTILA